MSIEPNKPLKIKDLLDFGIPKACYCRTDENLEIKPEDRYLFINTGLKNAYNKEIVFKFLDLFGKDEVLSAINKRKDYRGNKFLNDIYKIIKEYNSGVINEKIKLVWYKKISKRRNWR